MVMYATVVYVDFRYRSRLRCQFSLLRLLLHCLFLSYNLATASRQQSRLQPWNDYLPSCVRKYHRAHHRAHLNNKMQDCCPELDSASVDVSLEIAAPQAPTAPQITALKTEIAAAVGVPEGELQDYAVAASPNRRLSSSLSAAAAGVSAAGAALSAPVRRRGLLAVTYTWTASFTLSGSLSSLGFAASDDLAASVETSLASPTFATDAAWALGGTAYAVDSLSVAAEPR